MVKTEVVEEITWKHESTNRQQVGDTIAATAVGTADSTWVLSGSASPRLR